MLTINNIKAHNFIKFKDLDLNLKDLGIVLLKGRNMDEPEKGASGVGKTLLGDPLYMPQSRVLIHEIVHST